MTNGKAWFGLRENPWTRKHNRDTLEAEIGDLSAAVLILASLGGQHAPRRRKHEEQDRGVPQVRRSPSLHQDPGGRMMHEKVRQALEEIDAALFSGDTFEDPDNRAVLEEYLERWTAETRLIASAPPDHEIASES